VYKKFDISRRFVTVHGVMDGRTTDRIDVAKLICNALAKVSENAFEDR